MTFDANRYTEKSREAITRAQTEARGRGHQEVDNWHLLAAMLTQFGGILPGLLKRMEITPAAVELALGRELDKLPRVTGSTPSGTIYVTSQLGIVFNHAEKAAEEMHDEYVSVEHLFLGLIRAKDHSGMPSFLKTSSINSSLKSA